MPFGIKPLERRAATAPLDVEIDFDAVYNNLLEPALRLAGCEPCRADSDTAAGDIRTDMFFELVTADLVVADTSIPNPNVYYELGVRHAFRRGDYCRSARRSPHTFRSQGLLVCHVWNEAG